MQRNKKKSKIQEILEEEGNDSNWLVEEVKKKFKISKKQTFDIINGKVGFTIDDKFRFACCLGVQYTVFN